MYKTTRGQPGPVAYRLSPPVVSTAADSSRLHAFDALRGFAMLLGIVLHASIGYMTGPVPNLPWGIRDAAARPCFDWLFWWIHSFRLPIFFLLAGCLSARACDRSGAWAFLRERCRRLLVPLLVFSPVV